MRGLILKSDDELKISVNKDSNGLITEGLSVGDITNQNIEFVVDFCKNEIKQDPTKCVGIIGYIDEDSPENLLRSVRTELNKEGMSIKKLSIENNELIIDATY